MQGEQEVPQVVRQGVGQEEQPAPAKAPVPRAASSESPAAQAVPQMGAGRDERPSLTQYERERKSVRELISHARAAGWNQEFKEKFGEAAASSKIPMLSSGKPDDELADAIMSSPVERAGFDKELAEIDRLIASVDDLLKLRGKGVTALDKQYVDAYRQRGKAPEAAKYDLVSFLRGDRKLYDFGDRYRPGKPSRAYDQAFSEDSSLERAKAISKISSLDDPQFDTKMAEAIRAVRSRVVVVERYERDYASPPPTGAPKRHEVDAEALGLARIKQLRDLRAESVEAEANPVVYPEDQPGRPSISSYFVPGEEPGVDYAVLQIEGSAAETDPAVQQLQRLVAEAARRSNR